MLQRILKNVIKESTTEQLIEMYYEFVKTNSLRAAQEIGMDETLSRIIVEVAAEMNARMGGSEDLQLPPAA
jgi:hypothetical protein